MHFDRLPGTSSYFSTIAMISKLEDTLLRSCKPKDGFREILFDFLDDGVSLRRLRAVSRVLHDLVDHRPGRLFRNLTVTAPLNEQQDVNSLELVLPFCHNLTITIPAEERAISRHSDPRSSLGDDDHVSLERQFSIPGTSRNVWRREARIKYGSRFRALAPPGQHMPGQQPVQNLTRQRWLSLFSRCHQLQSLTLQIHGDPSWPGRTKVEDAVVDIRTSLERAPLPKLREVHITPVHAMGIVHLRWTGFSSFGTLPTADKLSMIWERLEVLDLQLRNPLFASGRLSPVQEIMFKKVLYDYLRSFAPTLRRLRFVWLDGDGPSPLTLHLEIELEDRPALEWPNLEDLWVGNVTFPHRAMRLASELAPKLERLWSLKASHRDSSMDLGASDAWINVTLDKRNTNLGVWKDTASSVYSQSARSSGYESSAVSRTSRVVPFVLDLNWRPPPP